MLPSKFIAQTDFGRFNIRITDGTYINIGGKNDCVQVFYKLPGEGVLDRLETNKGHCEIDDNPIRGKLTVNMSDLGFTILRILFPDVYSVHLIDSAKFKCTLSSGNTVPMSYKEFFLLIKGKTYYEDRFNAEPVKEYEQKTVITFRKNLNDPDKKPKVFGFNNKDLNELLTPLYNESTTWKEFIIKLQDKYKDAICQYMYPWYREAYYAITETEITNNWKIDIRERPIINFKILNSSNNNYTRRNYVYDPKTYIGGSYLYNIPYRQLFTTGQTRKILTNKAE